MGIFAGAFGAIAYLITEPWLAWAGRWRGLVFGFVLLFTASDVAIQPENIDFALLRNQELNVGMFSALFIGFGLLMAWVRQALDARLPQAGPGATTLYGILVTFGALFLIIFVATFFDEGETNQSNPHPGDRRLRRRDGSGDACAMVAIGEGSSQRALATAAANSWLRDARRRGDHGRDSTGQRRTRNLIALPGQH